MIIGDGNMADNLKIRVLREDMIALLNQSTLPIEVKRMVVKEVHDLVNDLADKTVQAELEAEAKAQEEKKGEE